MSHYVHSKIVGLYALNIRGGRARGFSRTIEKYSDKITDVIQRCFSIFFFISWFLTGFKKKLITVFHTSISLLKFSFFLFSLVTWLQFVLYEGHFHVLAIFVIAANFENQTANVAWNPFLGNTFHHLWHGHFHSLLSTSCWHEKRIKHANALRQHGNV